MTWRLRFAAEARADLQAIGAYLRDEARPRAAARYVRDISRRLTRLRDMPKAGVSIPDYGAAVRFVPCRSHVIYYELDKRLIVILRILHSAQDRDAIMRSRRE